MDFSVFLHNDIFMTLVILIQIFLLGIGLSADAFSVALTDGLTYTDISKKKSFFIAGTFGFMQALMPLIGFWLVEIIEIIAGQVAGEYTSLIKQKIQDVLLIYRQ